MFDIYLFIEAIWLVLPAYAANGFAPLARGKRPIDGGRRMRDAERIFGDGKTWEGFIFGVIVAIVIATIMMFAQPYLPWDQAPVDMHPVPMSPFLGLMIGLGVMMGDLGGSFVKRRSGLPRGSAAPLMDQEDFIIGMFVFIAPFVFLKPEWVLIILIITPIIHLTANFFGYLLKVKREPW